MIVMSGWQPIADRLLDSTNLELTEQTVEYTESQLVFLLDVVSDIEPAAVITTFLFLSLVGTGLYIFIWLVVGVITDLRNQIQISLLYVHPDTFHQSQHWSNVIGRYAIKFLTFCLAVLFGVLFIEIIVPGSVFYVRTGVDGSLSILLGQILLAISSLIGAMHIEYLLLKLTTGSFHQIEKG
jgi:hypothetical protein